VVGTYRVQFQIMDESLRPAWRHVEIEVSGESVDDARAKATEVARREYGDSATPTGLVTYFPPASG
jgi:hypothetical protein